MAHWPCIAATRRPSPLPPSITEGSPPLDRTDEPGAYPPDIEWRMGLNAIHNNGGPAQAAIELARYGRFQLPAVGPKSSACAIVALEDMGFLKSEEFVPSNKAKVWQLINSAKARLRDFREHHSAQAAPAPLAAPNLSAEELALLLQPIPFSLENAPQEAVGSLHREGFITIEGKLTPAGKSARARHHRQMGEEK